jgi:hypothetical protein
LQKNIPNESIQIEGGMGQQAWLSDSISSSRKSQQNINNWPSSQNQYWSLPPVQNKNDN